MQDKLDDAIQEVIRAKAQLQSLESRAQAASMLAEAGVALSTQGTVAPRPEILQAEQLLEMSAAEFDNENYGGSLYLTSQAKSLIAVAHGAGEQHGSSGPGRRSVFCRAPSAPGRKDEQRARKARRRLQGYVRLVAGRAARGSGL